MVDRKPTWTRSSILEAFQTHMARTRGTCPEVQRNYARYVGQYLDQVFCRRAPAPRELKPTDAITFVDGLARRYQPATVQVAVSGLRAFHRFLRATGLRSDRLEDAVPSVPRPCLASLPRHLDEETLRRFLGSLRSGTPCALRDRAMILCIARLGLRAGEVARIQLADFDWRAGILSVRTRKTGRGARLPLPADVGRAIAAYLRRGRPATDTRSLFVLHHIRVGAPAEARTVIDAVVEALRRAKLDVPSCGPYLLRHTLATHLLHRGASLKEIADLLGHRSIATTQIYAKLDLDALRCVAQPWPEVAS